MFVCKWSTTKFWLLKELLFLHDHLSYLRGLTPFLEILVILLFLYIPPYHTIPRQNHSNLKEFWIFYGSLPFFCCFSCPFKWTTYCKDQRLLLVVDGVGDIVGLFDGQIPWSIRVSENGMAHDWNNHFASVWSFLVRGVPLYRWMAYEGKIPSRNGWWLGLPPWLWKPPSHGEIHQEYLSSFLLTCIYIYILYLSYLVGGWATPLKKMNEFVNWDE